MNYLNYLRTGATSQSAGTTATDENATNFNQPKKRIGLKVAIGFAVGLSLVLIFIFSCIAYVWCTKTVIVDGRRVRKWKCFKGGATENFGQVQPQVVIVPNLRVGEDGLVYHVDDSQIRNENYQIQQNAHQYNEREGFSPDSMMVASQQQQQPGLENMGAYPVFQIQPPLSERGEKQRINDDVIEQPTALPPIIAHRNKKGMFIEEEIA